MVGDFSPDRADEILIADAELATRPLVQEIAESGDPVFAVMRRRPEHRIGDTGPEKTAQAVDRRSVFRRENRTDRARADRSGPSQSPARPSIAAAVEPARLP